MDTNTSNSSMGGMIPKPSPEASKPAPPPQGKKLFTGERIALLICGVLLIVAAAVLVMFMASAGRSVKDVVNAKAGTTPMSVQEIITQVSIPGLESSSVVFYLTEDGMASAVLKLSLTGYKAVTLAGSLSLAQDGSKGRWATSGEYFDGRSYLVYGVLLDDKVRGVEVDGNPTVLVDTGTFRCWFYVGSGALSISSDSVDYII